MGRRETRLSDHHILFPRQEWELRDQGRRLRQRPGLIARIRRDDHDHMHDVLPLVPLIGYHTLHAVDRMWTPTGNTYEDIDGLALSIESATAHPRSHQLEKDLGDLAIEALMIQKQVLKEIGYE